MLRPSLGDQVRAWLAHNNIIVYVAFIAVFILFSILLGSNFTSVNNVLNIARQTAMISIMAVAMTFVIGSGQIDLSIGSIAALSSLVAALILRDTGNILLALACALVLGAGIGLVNGLLNTKAGIPSFLTTLGMMGVIRGFAMWITNTAAVPIQNSTFNTIFGIGNVGGLPVLLLWTVVFAVVGYLLLNRMRFGRHTLAVGGNESAARFSGINTQSIKIRVMMMSGLFAAIAGVMYAARMQSGRWTFGEGDELSVIAAVILGGTSMAGGNGTIIGAVVGSMLMGMINNGLVLGGLSVAQQTIIRGAIIILATAIANRSNAKRQAS
ncbi:MAG: ABC transporter permease [Cellulomonadaceae bacterium]|nr:ABC transporter permease [Cellulomonadaceae bacterium]